MRKRGPAWLLWSSGLLAGCALVNVERHDWFAAIDALFSVVNFYVWWSGGLR